MFCREQASTFTDKKKQFGIQAGDELFQLPLYA